MPGEFQRQIAALVKRFLNKRGPVCNCDFERGAFVLNAGLELLALLVKLL